MQLWKKYEILRFFTPKMNFTPAGIRKMWMSSEIESLRKRSQVRRHIKIMLLQLTCEMWMQQREKTQNSRSRRVIKVIFISTTNILLQCPSPHNFHNEISLINYQRKFSAVLLFVCVMKSHKTCLSLMNMSII